MGGENLTTTEKMYVMKGKREGELTAYGRQVLEAERIAAAKYRQKYGAATMLQNIKNPRDKINRMCFNKGVFEDARMRTIVRLLKDTKSHRCECNPDMPIVRTGLSGNAYAAILALLCEINDEINDRIHAAEEEESDPYEGYI